jgi:hypothetical protein
MMDQHKFIAVGIAFIGFGLWMLFKSGNKLKLATGVLLVLLGIAWLAMVCP